MSKYRSRGDAFIVPQHATESFLADDLFLSLKSIIAIGPCSSERLISLRLVRTYFVVMNQVFGDKIIEVLLSESHKTIQNFVLDRLDSSLDESDLFG